MKEMAASDLAKDVTEIIAQLPPVVEALTGVKLEELLKHLPRLKGGQKTSVETEGS